MYELQELERMLDYNRKRLESQAKLIAEKALSASSDNLIGYINMLQTHFHEVMKLEIQLKVIKEYDDKIMKR